MSALVCLSDNAADSPQGAGGAQRRSAQLHQLAREAGAEVVVVPPTALTNLGKYYLGLGFVLSRRLTSRLQWRLLRHHGACVARWHEALRKAPERSVVLWEFSHRNNLALPRLARSAARAVLAAPQNIESLVPGRRPQPPRVQAAWLAEEAQALAMAQTACCISPEDQWLVSLFGAQGHPLPYYPAQRFLPGLEQVRARRQEIRAERFLTLGSVGNPPTHAGMIELLQQLRLSPRGMGLPLDIAGFGTEELAGYTEGTPWRVLGGLPATALDELLAKTCAVLIHQRPTTGALTRIPDLLVAGIPVICNRAAARGVAACPGVYVYDTLDELHRLLEGRLPLPPLPERPRGAEQQFIAALQRLALESRAAFNAAPG